MPRCKKCGAPIIWNRDHYEETGKWVPHDEATEELHVCPESNWNSGSGYGGSRGGIDSVDAISIDATMTRLEDKMDGLSKTMLKIIIEIQTVKMRIEGQMPLFPTNKNIAATVTNKPINESEIVTLSESESDHTIRSGENKDVNIPTRHE